MIDGVRVKQLKPVADERGRLMEILRADDDIFVRFGQIYITTVYPGAIKGWHAHRQQTDFLAAISGMVKLVLYDARENSPTRREVQEFFMGEHNPLLVAVPPHVFHGFKGIGQAEAMVLNCPTHVYCAETPDEIRLPPDTPQIPYSWDRRDR